MGWNSNRPDTCDTLNSDDPPIARSLRDVDEMSRRREVRIWQCWCAHQMNVSIRRNT